MPFGGFVLWMNGFYEPTLTNLSFLDEYHGILRAEINRMGLCTNIGLKIAQLRENAV